MSVGSPVVSAPIGAETTPGFEHYVRTHGAALIGFARRICGDHHRGEDVVQEVLARCMIRWPDIATGNPHAYLRRAIVHEYLSVRRRRWTTEVLRSPFGPDGLPDRAGTEPVVSDCLGETDEMRAALAALPSRQRIVLVLRYYLDWPDDEIASVLRCPASTVRSHARRGLRRLREQFADGVQEVG